MCVLNFWAASAWNNSNSRKSWVRYNDKCTQGFVYSTGYCCRVLRKLKRSRQTFDKYSNINFHDNPCSESRVVPCGRTDGRSHTTKPIVALRNFANATKIPSSVPKQDQVSRLYMDLYSAAWSVCVETDSIQLTAVTATDTLPHSQ